MNPKNMSFFFLKKKGKIIFSHGRGMANHPQAKNGNVSYSSHIFFGELQHKKRKKKPTKKNVRYFLEKNNNI